MDAPVGALAIPKDLLRTSLATCTAFRNWDGLSLTVAQAKERIYLDALPPPTDGKAYSPAEMSELRPFAIVYTDSQNGLEYDLESSGYGYAARGRLMVRLERAFPDVSGETDPDAAADRQFENFLGPLLHSEDVNNPGLLELAGQPGYLMVRSAALAFGPSRVDPRDRAGLGDFQVAFLSIEWGRRV